MQYVEGQSNIYRYGSKRMVTVRTNIHKCDQGGFVNELQVKLEGKIQLPKGYSIGFEGNMKIWNVLESSWLLRYL